jgi:uncharacterized membrane protein
MKRSQLPAYRMNLCASCLFASLLAFGCGGAGADGESENVPEQDQQLLKGFAVFGHEVRTVRACDAAEPSWAIDSSGVLWDVHHELAPGAEPYEEVFVIVTGRPVEAPLDGFGADYPGAFIVETVLYAAREGFGCGLDLDGFDYRISGNEPFWTLVLSGETAELNRMGEPTQRWEEIRRGPDGEAVRYRAESGGLVSLDVTIRTEPCRDSMSGAFFGYAATLMLSDGRLNGCALRGTAAETGPP